MYSEFRALSFGRRGSARQASLPNRRLDPSPRCACLQASCRALFVVHLCPVLHVPCYIASTATSGSFETSSGTRGCNRKQGFSCQLTIARTGISLVMHGIITHMPYFVATQGPQSKPRGCGHSFTVPCCVVCGVDQKSDSAAAPINYTPFYQVFFIWFNFAGGNRIEATLS